MKQSALLLEGVSFLPTYLVVMLGISALGWAFYIKVIVILILFAVLEMGQRFFLARTYQEGVPLYAYILFFLVQVLFYLFVYIAYRNLTVL